MHEELTKVHIDLPRHWATGGEAMWARSLGEDLYELRNVPFYAYDLNYLDVVRATADAPSLKPEVRAVVRRSGHATLRVFFADTTSETRRFALLAQLGPLQVRVERATGRLFALDLQPGANVAEVRAKLDEWSVEGALHYETCEARVPGSFDEESTK